MILGKGWEFNLKKMPIDYKKYHKDWKTVIRPAILNRANNCCEQCKAPNYSLIFRGIYKGIDIYQDASANIFNATSGEYIKSDYYADITPSTGNENQQAIKVVLTISHTDHDVNNNDYSNLKALCQRCHLRHDVEHHKRSRKNKLGMKELF